MRLLSRKSLKPKTDNPEVSVSTGRLRGKKRGVYRGAVPPAPRHLKEGNGSPKKSTEWKNITSELHRRMKEHEQSPGYTHSNSAVSGTTIRYELSSKSARDILANKAKLHGGATDSSSGSSWGGGAERSNRSDGRGRASQSYDEPYPNIQVQKMKPRTPTNNSSGWFMFRQGNGDHTPLSSRTGSSGFSFLPKTSAFNFDRVDDSDKKGGNAKARLINSRNLAAENELAKQLRHKKWLEQVHSAIQAAKLGLPADGSDDEDSSCEEDDARSISSLDLLFSCIGNCGEPDLTENEPPSSQKRQLPLHKSARSPRGSVSPRQKSRGRRHRRK